MAQKIRIENRRIVRGADNHDSQFHWQNVRFHSKREAQFFYCIKPWRRLSRSRIGAKQRALIFLGYDSRCGFFMRRIFSHSWIDDARRFWPLWAIGAASFVGALTHSFGDRETLFWILGDRASLRYFLFAPFLHGGLLHFLLNFFALRFLGEALIRVVGNARFLALFVAGAVAANLANNGFGDAPAVGISGAIFAILGVSIYPFGQTPVKLLVISDILRLPPFRLQTLALVLAAIDIAGVIFDWGFFAHWGHLGGLAAGLFIGSFWFPGRRPYLPRRYRRRDR